MSDNCEADRNNYGDEYEEAGSKESKHLDRKHTRYPNDKIEVMEELFRVCQHPDEKQRQDLSDQLGLEPSKIKFWFQNRRTQMKAQQVRTHNAMLRTENETLKLDNLALVKTINNIKCLKCEGSDLKGQMTYTINRLEMENAVLKDEFGKISAVASNSIGRPIPSLEAQTELISSLNHGAGSSGKMQIALPSPTCVSMDSINLDKSLVMKAAVNATEELIQMIETNEPLWVKKPWANGTTEVLNADEFCRAFPRGMRLNSNMKREGSRDSSIVSITGVALVDVFMDANKWKEMFPSIVTRAQTLQVYPGVPGNRNGSLQQMYAELQVLSPLVSTRQISFFRFSQQLSPGMWVVVDFSPESLSCNASASVGCYRKHLSGCVIQDMHSGYSKVTWVEHGEVEDRMVHDMYEQLINSGMTFSAQRWMACLQRQCEWSKILVDVTRQGASTVQPRNMIRLAQNMSIEFFANISALSAISQSTNDPIKITTRPASQVRLSNGVVICVGTSVRLSVSPQQLFDFLGDEQTRSQCNILSCGTWEKSASITNGPDPANCITLFNVYNEGNSEMTLKQSCTDASGTVVVYAVINVEALNSEDASPLPIPIPYGFVILPYHTTPSILRKAASSSSLSNGGSLLTLVFQVTEPKLSTCRLSVEYVASIHNVINTNIERIKSVFRCDD